VESKIKNNMKIIAFDTTTKLLSLGFYDGSRLAEFCLEAGKLHSSLLSETIKRALNALDWDISDVDYFACGIGPGSFTGVRIGLACVKGLAWSLHKPVVGIPSLDILAQNVDKDGIITAAIDAKRNLVYCCLYKRKDNTLKRISDYMLLSVEDFIKKIPARSVIVGDAVHLYKKELLLSAKRLIITDKDYWRLWPRNMISLCLDKIKRGQVTDAFTVTPIYLYTQECQIRERKSQRHQVTRHQNKKT